MGKINLLANSEGYAPVRLAHAFGNRLRRFAGPAMVSNPELEIHAMVATICIANILRLNAAINSGTSKPRELAACARAIATTYRVIKSAAEAISAAARRQGIHRPTPDFSKYIKAALRRQRERTGENKNDE
jgi:hypothetical protein